MNFAEHIHLIFGRWYVVGDNISRLRTSVHVRRLDQAYQLHTFFLDIMQRKNKISSTICIKNPNYEAQKMFNLPILTTLKIKSKLLWPTLLIIDLHKLSCDHLGGKGVI